MTGDERIGVLSVNFWLSFLVTLPPRCHGHFYLFIYFWRHGQCGRRVLKKSIQYKC